jgi:hypothetical protein
LLVLPQEDKLAKPGNLPESNLLSEYEGLPFFENLEKVNICT